MHPLSFLCFIPLFVTSLFLIFVIVVVPGFVIIYFISKCSYLNPWLPFSDSPPSPSWRREEQAAAWYIVAGWG